LSSIHALPTSSCELNLVERRRIWGSDEEEDEAVAVEDEDEEEEDEAVAVEDEDEEEGETNELQEDSDLSRGSQW